MRRASHCSDLAMVAIATGHFLSAKRFRHPKRKTLTTSKTGTAWHWITWINPIDGNIMGDDHKPLPYNWL